MSAGADDQRIQTVIAFSASILSLGILGLIFNGTLADPISELRQSNPADLAARNAALQGVIHSVSAAACWAAIGVAAGAVLAVFGGRVEAFGKGINAGAAILIAITAGFILQVTAVAS